MSRNGCGSYGLPFDDEGSAALFDKKQTLATIARVSNREGRGQVAYVWDQVNSWQTLAIGRKRRSSQKDDSAPQEKSAGRGRNT